MEKILVTGALGQLGTELIPALQKVFGETNVISTDIRLYSGNTFSGPFETLNVLDRKALSMTLHKHRITQIYHLAAVLSAKGEHDPLRAWDINMNGLTNVLEAARDLELNKVYWPSSIGVFGPDTPRVNTPQFTIMNPATVYGISKLAGEQWCAYYQRRYDVDVRSVRYPGLIGHHALPGGGTTDYAVEMYYSALNDKPYTCYLRDDTVLPMMYMPDAIRATIELMEAEKAKLTVSTSYNIAGMSFTPAEIYQTIKSHIPTFTTGYKPDFRQEIADSWPQTIDDSYARNDWGWMPAYDLEDMTTDMLAHLRGQKKKLTV